ncbi:MAG: hypothetical protein CVT98_07170, partial [Bacteroidetes bacterium HGW-Bacteroidetes-15]
MITKTFTFNYRLNTRRFLAKVMKTYFSILVVSFLVLLSFGETFAQKTIVIDGYKVLPAIVFDGDTMANVLIPQIVVFPKRKFSSKRDLREYQRLIRNLKIVYPYAQIAKYKISEMDAHYRTLKTERERQAYVKQVEKELREEFEHQLVKLTFSQ